jgi:tetratricopeptide (TPR) repeat protein
VKRALRLVLCLACLGAAAPATAAADPQQSYLEGLINERFGRPADALSFYRRAAELDPSSRFLQETLANLCLRLGRLDEALAAARKVAALVPADPAAQVLIGRIQLAKGNRAEAGTAFERALALDPANGEGLVYSAFLRTNDDPAKAVTFLQRYLQENPGSVEALTRLAALYETLKQTDKAEDLWRQASERAPTEPGIHAALARLAEARGDRAAALAEYEAARFLEPRNVEILVPLGETYYRLGRAQEARDTLNEALRLAPDDAAARFGLSLLDEDAGDWDAAARHMAFVAKNSDRPEVGVHLSELQVMAGRPKDALKTLRALQKSFPKDADVWYHTGMVLDELRRTRRALKAFQKTVELAPDRPDALFHAAADLDALKCFSKAEPLLLKAAALERQGGLASNYLAYSWADRGLHLEEALALARRSAQSEPDNGAFLDTLGWCLFKLGRLPEAESVLSRAVHRSEDEALIWEHYGDVLKALGRGEEAARAWQEGYVLNPRSASLIERLGGKGQAPRVTPLTAPRALLKRVAGNFLPLRSLAGGVNIGIKRGLRSFSVDGVFYYRRPRLFRVEVLGGFLAPAAVVVSNADGVTAAGPDGAVSRCAAGAACEGAAAGLPAGAWFDLLGDALSGELAQRFDDPAVRVEQKGGELIYRSAAGELRIDGKGRVMTRAASGGVTLRFGDYREESGYKVPGSIGVDLADGTTLSLSFRKLRADGDAGDDLFKTPGAPR